MRYQGPERLGRNARFFRGSGDCACARQSRDGCGPASALPAGPRRVVISTCRCRELPRRWAQQLRLFWRKRQQPKPLPEPGRGVRSSTFSTPSFPGCIWNDCAPRPPACCCGRASPTDDDHIRSKFGMTLAAKQVPDLLHSYISHLPLTSLSYHPCADHQNCSHMQVSPSGR